MIEMRWTYEEVPVVCDSTGAVVVSRMDNKRLQYRQRTDHPIVREDYNWSEWQDVPSIS